ncbi:hypothetical protein M3I54_40725 [Paraburkholderia sp. CNPSo 3274]|uniref:hypothetical protein n=1 Tax=Paraburkholderia sp. CNPSo 3274 TaxID=2940932 RepID=UPI0020B76949|nr:hypothetical protein [Paraburkholderia sp. CNPSo 3274]MCP3713136.1 hypothetical protein [Paraburkholderia sp. CNPSo 3274]
MNLKREPKTKNEKSIVALERFLAGVASKPEEFTADEELLSALKRQSRLAKFSKPESEVIATSRCTIERVAERLFYGGFRYLDTLRLTALASLQTATAEAGRGKRRTKQRLADDLVAANVSRVQALVDCWQITNAFHRALKEGRQLANLSRDPALVARWDKTEATLLAMFDLADRPIVKTNSEAEKWLMQLRS